MSLARLALRLSTVKALANQTLAEDRVRDSEIGPLDENDRQEPAPIISVYTGGAALEVMRRDLLSQRGNHQLIIETAITTRMKNKDGWEIPLTDAGMEMSLEVINRQINVALMDPANEWAEIWRSFATISGEVKLETGSSAKPGVRYAGSRILIPVELVKDPVPGEPHSQLWEAFFEKAEAEPDLAPTVQMMRDLAAGSQNYTTWQGLRAAYGITSLEAKALQIEPASINEDAPAIASVELTQQATGIGSDIDASDVA